MLIDFHVHLYDEPGYGESLAETARNLGIERMAIGGGEARYGLAANAAVRRLADSYPDLFVPFARVNLRSEGADRVERYSRTGFRGLRVCGPPAPYDSREFFPVYEAADALGLPVLFHTGFLPPTQLDRASGVRVEHMRPVHLDTVARCFPGLRIVGVGLGRPWLQEAVEVMRYHPGVHFDLSRDLFRVVGVDELSRLLKPASSVFWEATRGGNVAGQLVFGSGTRSEHIAATERDYQRLFRAMGLAPDDIDRIMGANAAEILGISTQTTSLVEG